MIAIAAVFVGILAALFLAPMIKWVLAALASLLIAIPPYPNWLWWDEEQGWHLRWGYKLQHVMLSDFAIFFVVAMLLFATLFWAIGKRQPK